MTVHYDTDNHFGIIFRLSGTVWWSVLPYCIANSILTAIIWYLQVHGYNITVKATGHSYLTIMVAFLVVARSNLAYGRFWEARTKLGHLLSTSRQLSMCVVCFSGRDNNQKAKDWRSSIKRRLIRLLRAATKILQDESLNAYLMIGPEEDKAKDFIDPVDHAAGLQAIIQGNDAFLAKPLNFLECNKLHSFVTGFVATYYDISKFTTTPYPFPIVQMARTILFVWIFTLPLALVHEITEVKYACTLMFFITYGFIGLEYVSIELHDPFGDDPNDFETQEYTDTICEEIEYELSCDNKCLFDADFDEALSAHLGNVQVRESRAVNRVQSHRLHLQDYAGAVNED